MKTNQLDSVIEQMVSDSTIEEMVASLKEVDNLKFHMGVWVSEEVYMKRIENMTIMLALLRKYGYLYDVSKTYLFCYHDAGDKGDRCAIEDGDVYSPEYTPRNYNSEFPIDYINLYHSNRIIKYIKSTLESWFKDDLKHFQEQRLLNSKKVTPIARVLEWFKFYGSVFLFQRGLVKKPPILGCNRYRYRTSPIRQNFRVSRVEMNKCLEEVHEIDMFLLSRLEAEIIAMSQTT